MRTSKIPLIFYLCDRKACANCNPDCAHTRDITHAKNFISQTTIAQTPARTLDKKIGYFEGDGQ